MSQSQGPAIGQTFPGTQVPLVGSDGCITAQWWRFLLSLYTTTGGGTPFNVPAVAASATAAEAAAEAAATAAEEAQAAASVAQVQGLFDNYYEQPDQGALWSLMLSP